jgi:hypothetical protein
MRSIASSSCSPQSQRSDPNTSPVRHCEWIRKQFALDQGDIRRRLELVAVDDHAKLAGPAGRHPGFGLATNVTLVAPIRDEVGDAQDADAVQAGKPFEIGHPRH